MEFLNLQGREYFKTRKKYMDFFRRHPFLAHRYISGAEKRAANHKPGHPISKFEVISLWAEGALKGRSSFERVL